MGQFKPYALASLPTTGIDVNGVYFTPIDGTDKFQINIRKSDNSAWVTLGILNSVDTVNGLTGAVQLDLSLNSSTGVLSITGGGASVNLDGRYRKLGVLINWSELTGVPGYAMDNSVVHTSGNETVGGTKTFSASPAVPTPSTSSQAANKSYVDSQASNLQTQINNINTSISSGLKYKGGMSCSSNPNYPAGSVGDVYVVTTAGKIGGASGIAVEVGDMLICQTAGSEGTQAAVGSNWNIIQSNIGQATESVAGYAEVATDTETNAGTDDTKMVTPKKLNSFISANNAARDTANVNKFVRHDTNAQGLPSTNKANARTNIGAADDATVVHMSGNETVGGTKTFSTIPLLPASNPTSDNQAVRKKYVDDSITAATNWGGPNGKEW